MVSYVVTMVVPWILMVVLVIGTMAIKEGGIATAGEVLSLYSFLLWIAVPYNLLGLWGVTAVYFERKQKVLVNQVAEIRKSSWHYRLNKKVNGYNWKPSATECQYWAKTFHAMLVNIPGYCIVIVVVYASVLAIRFIGSVIGFLISYQVNWWGGDIFEPMSWFAHKDSSYYDSYKHQFWGPGLALVLAIGWFFWTFSDLLPTVGVYLALLAAVVGVVWLLHRAIWRVLQGLWFAASAVWQVVFVSGFGALFNYLLVRRLTCRKVRYVD